MTAGAPTISARDNSRLADLVDRLTEKLAADDADAAEDILRAHPEHAELLRQLLPTLEVLARLGTATSSPLPPLPLSPRLSQLGDFRLLAEVGRGGMGIVYEAEQLSLRRRVALKVLPLAALLDERLLARFRAEAQAAASLAHPHIVPIYGVGCERGVHFYAMQYIEGMSLDRVIASLKDADTSPKREQEVKDQDPGVGAQESNATFPRPQPLKPNSSSTLLATLSTERSHDKPAFFRRVAELGIQAAEALQYAHEQGIIHRDIKPGNLLLDKHGKLWVTDFGLARIEGESNLTGSGDFLGTLRYMSPEQALGNRLGTDHRTDIYSLGATLYELLTLQPVVSGEDRGQMLRNLADKDRRSPRTSPIPTNLERVIAKSLARDPADRYSAAGELAADLKRWLDAKPIAVHYPASSNYFWKSMQSRSTAIAGSLVVVSALIIAGWATAHRDPAHPLQESAPRVAPHTEREAYDATPARLRPPVSIPPPAGLVAWWSGDGHADDYAGTNHGIAHGGLTFAPGVVGHAFCFDGIDDYIRIPHRDVLNPNAGFTIEAWVRSNCLGYRNLICKWDTTTGNCSYCLQDLDSPVHRFRFMFTESGRRPDVVTINGRHSLRAGVWTHVATTVDTEMARIYVNGVLDVNDRVGAARQIHRGNADVCLGFSGRWFFSGMIDEVSLYNRALQSDEIRSIYRAGSAGKMKPMPHGLMSSLP